jgi:ring-1,2-phenylacetyl-CoA epoxidase subunit PaaC
LKELPEHIKPLLAELLLAVADDKLVLGHRNSDWTGLAPILEEDIAFSALAQDEIGHAQALYEIIGPLVGKTPDQLAFGRTPAEYRCCTIVELPDEFDWATAVCRQFFCDHFDALRLDRLSRSSYKLLADLARRLRAEEQIHIEHADGWITRLGAGTSESKTRMQQALEALVPHVASLFEPTAGQETLEANGWYPALDGDLFELWVRDVTAVTTAAKLTFAPAPPDGSTRGGRNGEHSPHLKSLLEEMCEVWRLEPNVAW